MSQHDEYTESSESEDSGPRGCLPIADYFVPASVVPKNGEEFLAQSRARDSKLSLSLSLRAEPCHDDVQSDSQDVSKDIDIDYANEVLKDFRTYQNQLLSSLPPPGLDILPYPQVAALLGYVPGQRAADPTTDTLVHVRGSETRMLEVIEKRTSQGSPLTLMLVRWLVALAALLPTPPLPSTSATVRALMKQVADIHDITFPGELRTAFRSLAVVLGLGLEQADPALTYLPR
eukprot:gnl/Dysnectes_brevis/1672_a1902_2059.p1 GENE.gnl/Dysnectes_brevis/1672_a1902_2059~~gnl/Dysnectes_brevis/1672_a1902_2059.p1  ORF type:complete len:232 (+),score=48.08 gnl/Dysnectes_brevis/1672_a1902_2059:97-792(+)